MPIFYKNINTLKQIEILPLYKRYLGVSKLDKKRIFNVFNTSTNGLKSRNVKLSKEKREFNIIYFLKKSSFDSLVIALYFLLIISLITKMFTISLFTCASILISLLIKSYCNFYLYKLNYKNKLQDINKTKVLIKGKEKKIAISEVLKGDIIKISSGDIIPSDSIVLNSNNFYINDIIFTGSNTPKEKTSNHNKGNDITNISNIVLKGSLAISGDAKLLVIEDFGNNYIDMLDKFHSAKEKILVHKNIIKSLVYIFVMLPILILVKIIFNTQMFSIFFLVLVSLTSSLIILYQLSINHKYKKYYEYFKNDNIKVKDMMLLKNMSLIDTIFISDSFFLSRFKLYKAFNFNGKEDDFVLEEFILNSSYKNLLKNEIDVEMSKYLTNNDNYELISTKPSKEKFASLVLLQNKKSKDYKMISVGSTDNIIPLCNKVKINNTTKKIDKVMKNSLYDKAKSYMSKGYTVLLVASKNTKNEIKINDNNNMTFTGFVLFKKIYKKKLMKKFKELNTTYNVKIFSDTILSDNVIHNNLYKINDIKLLELISKGDLFYKLDYLEKRRIIELLNSRGKKTLLITNDLDDILASKTASISITSSSSTILREISDIVVKDKSDIIDFIETSNELSKFLNKYE